MPLGPRCAGYGGYNLHAHVSVIASDRRGLEHLCRYVLRPPMAVGRVERLEDGTVRISMQRTWSDGTTAIDLSPTELVEKLAAIVPPPRAHTIVYAGVLAGNAASPRKLTRRPSAGTDRPGWAELLKRVFAVDGWACPHCAAPMRLRSIVIHPPAATRVVRGLLRATTR